MRLTVSTQISWFWLIFHSLTAIFKTLEINWHLRWFLTSSLVLYEGRFYVFQNKTNTKWSHRCKLGSSESMPDLLWLGYCVLVTDFTVWLLGWSYLVLTKSRNLHFQFFLLNQRNLSIKESLICVLFMLFLVEKALFKVLCVNRNGRRVPLKCPSFLLNVKVF